MYEQIGSNVRRSYALVLLFTALIAGLGYLFSRTTGYPGILPLAVVVAVISSVDLKKLPARFAGRQWSRELIAAFPLDCDPCGENGEIHTVVVAGPMLASPLAVHVGPIVERNGFAYADIIPADGPEGGISG